MADSGLRASGIALIRVLTILLKRSLPYPRDSHPAKADVRDFIWTAAKGEAGLDYIVHVSRGTDSVATHTLEAESDTQVFDLAIEWAAALLLAADDDVVLVIRLPSGAFKTFGRKDF